MGKYGEALNISCGEVKSKLLPLETKNSEKNENRRLGLINNLHYGCDIKV